jgi:hypothetical protein
MSWLRIPAALNLVPFAGTSGPRTVMLAGAGAGVLVTFGGPDVL